MKRILLFVVSISMVGILVAQENTWDIYLQGQAVKSFELVGNNIWVATDSFLVRLNKQDKNINYYRYPDFIEHMQRFSVKINLKIDNNEVIWIIRSVKQCPGWDCRDLYYNSIDTFDGNKWDKVEYKETGPIRSLAVNRDNNKWIVADWLFGHLYKLEQGNCLRYTPENSGLLYDYTPAVASDKKGNIWLGNVGNVGDLAVGDMALIKYDGVRWTSYLSERGPIPTAINFDDHGNPWVQNLFCVRKLDTVSYSWSEQISLSIDSTYKLLTYELLAIEGDNRFWFSNDNGGISTYDGSDWSFYTTSNSELPSDTVYQIAIDSNGTKWIGTANGLAAFKENGLLRSDSPESNMMNKITLFPNPAHDFIILKMSGEIQNLAVDILNIQGQTIKTFSIDSNQSQLDISNLHSGVYLVRIQSQQNHILKKFIKQ